MKTHRLPVPIVPIALALLCLSLSACGSAGIFRTIFTGVTSADAEFTGFKSGEPIPAATISPQAGQISSIFVALGQEDPLAQYVGTLMPVLVPGEPLPRWIHCTDEFWVKCKNIPLNTKVEFSGKPAGPWWKPTRLVAEGFDD